MLSHLPATAGMASKSATVSVRRRLATARTPESNTRESRPETMRAPPLIASTKARRRRVTPERSAVGASRSDAVAIGAALLSLTLSLARFRSFNSRSSCRHCGCFLFQERLGKCVRLGSSSDFADSLAVFAAPKRIGLRSHIQLSGVLVKSSSITSSDSFNLCSAGLKEPEGPDLRWDTV